MIAVAYDHGTLLLACAFATIATNTDRGSCMDDHVHTFALSKENNDSCQDH